jgi:hypothetical protein
MVFIHFPHVLYVPQIFHIFLDIFLDFFQAAEWLAGADALLIGSGVGGAQCIDVGLSVMGLP